MIAFDAAARHGALKRAAVELKVSQAAISRRIAALETDLGRPLVDHNSKPLALAKTGVELFDMLRSGLSRLEFTVTRIQREDGCESVTISAGAGRAAHWLTPRLAEIQAPFHRRSCTLSASRIRRRTMPPGTCRCASGRACGLGPWRRRCSASLPFQFAVRSTSAGASRACRWSGPRSRGSSQ